LKLFLVVLLHFLFYTSSHTAVAQSDKGVRWLDFGQLEDSLKANPKQVFIDFYADWCAPCLKMEKDVFTAPAIVEKLNHDYYAVKMNVESTDTVFFGDQVFVNERINKRKPVHQIPLLMGIQKNKPFSLPAMAFMDENFKAQARYFQYLNVEQLSKILSNEHNKP
jgi:thioredoxin-related protein